MTVFGDYLKFIRLKHGLTLEEVSEKAKVSPSYLSRIEHGKHVPQRDTIIKIAYGLGISIKNLHDFMNKAGYNCTKEDEFSLKSLYNVNGNKITQKKSLKDVIAEYVLENEKLSHEAILKIAEDVEEYYNFKKQKLERDDEE